MPIPTPTTSSALNQTKLAPIVFNCFGLLSLRRPTTEPPAKANVLVNSDTPMGETLRPATTPIAVPKAATPKYIIAPPCLFRRTRSVDTALSTCHRQARPLRIAAQAENKFE